MQRFWQSVKKLSLTQQLTAVVFVSLSFFIIFLLIFIFGNINVIVQEQLFTTIESSQNRLSRAYYQQGATESIFSNLDPSVVHIVYVKGDNPYRMTNAQGQIDTGLDHLFRNNILQQSEPYKRYESNSADISIVYQISHIDENIHVVSFVSKGYMEHFRQALINGVFNILLIIVGVLFLLLMLWVGYLIHSLKMIELYINRYRKGEAVELRIDRQDEVGELAKALVDMNKELKRQEELKEEMVQNISHDLKTPIATIKSYGESIKDGVYPYETLEKSVDVIIEHADRLERKVQSLLLLNRMGYLVADEKGQQKTDMKEVIEKVILSLKVVRPDVALRTNLTSTSFHGAEEPWRVVIENLLDNALRYAKTTIQIDLETDRVKIYNDGPSIPVNQMTNIFKAYEKGKGGQFGLGLTIVKRVVTAYHYTIRAENEEKGVSFIVEAKESKENIKDSDL